MGNPKMVWLAIGCGLLAVLFAPHARGQSLTEADLSGRYFVSEIRSGETLFYSLQFDGSGTITDVNWLRSSFTVFPNEDENLDTRRQEAIGIFDLDPYTVGFEGTITIPGRSLAGMLDETAGVFTLVQTATGGLPRLAIGIKTGENLSNTSLIGGYYIHVLELSVPEGDGLRFQTNAGVIDASINGLGDISGRLIAGDEQDLGQIFSATYSIDDDGRITLNRDQETTADIGILAGDSAVFSAVDTSLGDDDILVMIGVPKAATSVTDSDFLDAYFFSGFNVEGELVESASQYSNSFGEIAFSENGEFVLSENSTTAARPLETVEGNANTSTDGFFEAETAFGTLLEDGRFFVTTNFENGNTTLRVGIGKSSAQTTDGTDGDLEEPFGNDDFCFIETLVSGH